jgi:cobalt/nickel transport system permease protein
MHLGNGAITPECVAITFSAAAAGLAVSLGGIRRARPTRDKLHLAAALGCLVFAAQAINVPIAPGISGHFVGGALLAWMLGPALAAWTMTIVLTVQALALGDGGTLALGANVLNMALLPAALVAAFTRLSPARQQCPHSVAIAGLAATCAVPLAAALIVAETALFRPTAELTGWSSFAATMLGTHAWIGILEGAMTSLLLVALMPLASLSPTRQWRLALVGAASAVLMAALLVPISSRLPDGYEAAAQRTGLAWLLRP